MIKISLINVTRSGTLDLKDTLQKISFPRLYFGTFPCHFILPARFFYLKAINVKSFVKIVQKSNKT